MRNFQRLTLTLTLFRKRNKTPLFTEQKRTYWEAMSQGRPMLTRSVAIAVIADRTAYDVRYGILTNYQTVLSYKITYKRLVCTIRFNG